jgi:hypothetical protein
MTKADLLEEANRRTPKQVCWQRFGREERRAISARSNAGELRVLITKPTIAGFGLNWQHCARQTFFPSHSFEQWYQAVRRSWRFGQKSEVQRGRSHLGRRSARAGQSATQGGGGGRDVFAKLVELMNDALGINRLTQFNVKEEIPAWL